MNILETFLYYFYAPNGRFEACGMFTLSHIVAVFISIALIVVALLFLRKIDEVKKLRLTRLIAIILTVLEAIKILHSFIYKDLHLDAWFPLSYCGLFIFAAWMYGFGNRIIKKSASDFISYGCIIAGVAFLIFPTTSLMSYPAWHFFSLYSLFYHSVMIVFGIIFLKDRQKLNKKDYFGYSSFVIIFAFIAIILNCIYGSNLMNLREPYNIPIAFLQNAYSILPTSYTLITLVGYLIIPFISENIAKLLKRQVR